MNILNKLRANHTLKHPAPEPNTTLFEDLPHKLLQDVKELKQVYGNAKFIERIRRAANRLEEMEMILSLVAQTTKDVATKSLVQEAMDDLE
tara:strand:+ start:409 stop:681 length:273 start_codon:yes stop_codon:yes gene_type:complete